MTANKIITPDTGGQGLSEHTLLKPRKKRLFFADLVGFAL